EDDGFDGTNSNRIAARAGYAPQTFYRHFVDKLDIFLAVYAAWVDDEFAVLERTRDPAKAAAIIVRHHRRSLQMRRSLRHLTVCEPRVRAARAKSRLAQIERMRERSPRLNKATIAELAAALLLVERLADACAESEFGDLGVSPKAAEAQLELL